MGGNITGWNFLGGNFPGGGGVIRTDRDRYYIENICHQFPDLYMSWIWSTEAVTCGVL